VQSSLERIDTPVVRSTIKAGILFSEFIMSFNCIHRFILFLIVPVTVIAADPVTEMGEFSVFDKVDLGQLAQSGIKTATGAPMSTARYLSTQSCFIIPKPPDQVLAAMKRFDPTTHRELKVYLNTELPASPSTASFAKLNSAPENSAVQALSAATKAMSPDLQVSRAEAQKFSAGQPVFAFWTELLAKRAQDFVAGGASREAPYDHAKNSVQPGQELSGLMKQQPKISRQFGGFLGATGLLGSKGSLQADNYWQLLEVEDVGVLTLGASYTRAMPGGGAQLADGFYYASGGYNVALTLFQLWPVNAGGRASTLVWRGDFISANTLGTLHGIERLASEGAMRKDISKAATIFLRENSR
jgi:hypothetical protein